MCVSARVGAVTVDRGQHCGCPASEEGVSHGPEVGAAVTVSPWPTLWAPGPHSTVTHWGNAGGRSLADTVGARPPYGDTGGMRVGGRRSRHS